ncbi:MAG TPA: Gfo/Idh/MocA family oxidoreductase [Xanthobacteraceae bacterium]
MIRAAILGLGRWGRSLVNSVQGKSADIAFVAAHTRTRASAEDFCREKNLRFVDTYAQVLADPAVDAFVLATPHSLHAEQIAQAAAAGKHVFVEKPMTLDLASARTAADAAAKANVVLAVGFNRRFHPAIVEIRNRKAAGRLGAVVAMVGQHTTSTQSFLAADNWRSDPDEAPAGAMTAVGVHLMDHMIEFGGRVREVHCVTGVHGAGPADDTTTILFAFEGGATATIFCSVATATNFNFTVYGSKGLAEISGAALQSFRFVPTSDRAPTGPIMAPPAEHLDFAGFDMLNAEMTVFARAIIDKTPYPVPLAEVLHGMAVFDAVVKSAAARTIVRVEA